VRVDAEAQPALTDLISLTGILKEFDEGYTGAAFVD